MPYIAHERRVQVEHTGHTKTTGELNYVLTRQLDNYLFHHGLSYQSINDVLGALEGAKQEFYRRVAVPYENGKLSKNGDVYTSAVGELEPARD